MRIFIKLIIQGLTDFRRRPWIQALTLAAVTLVAFLAGLFLLVLHNLDQELQRSRGEIQFQVYWDPGADMEVVAEQWQHLEQLDRLADLTTFTPEQGLELLSASLGQSGGFDWLRGQSPLPATALLSFAAAGDDQHEWARGVYKRLENLPGVDKVSFNPLQLDLARSWSHFSNQVIWPLIVFLGLVLALVVGNTIKLAQVHRQNEVEILRLVGAARWYIQLPMLVSGALLGFLGGTLALLMLKGVQHSLKDLLHFPPLLLRLEYLPQDQALLFLAILTSVGVVSSLVALRES